MVAILWETEDPENEQEQQLLEVLGELACPQLACASWRQGSSQAGHLAGSDNREAGSVSVAA